MLNDDPSQYESVISENDVQIDVEPLSQERANKIRLIGELFDRYLETHYIPEGLLGQEFDRFTDNNSDKSVIELEILSKLYK